MLASIGKKTAGHLKHHGIETVGTLKALTDEHIDAITRGGLLSKLGAGQLMAIRDQAKLSCIDEDAPAPVDHRKDVNPYKSKYGDDWEAQINASVALSKYVCITEMIEFMMVSAAKVFKGTTHELDWVFYHDALSLMTAKETMEWMQQKGYLKRWILPENGLSSAEHDPDLTSYARRPPGDNPEGMPLDNSLNRDVHEAVKRHVLWTQGLAEGDSKRFDMSTPKHGARAYLRILCPGQEGVCPSSERIMHDVDKVFRNFRAIRDMKGIRLPNSVCQRHGKERDHSDKSVENRGGLRVRKQGPDKTFPTHKDALEAKRNYLTRATEKAQGSLVGSASANSPDGSAEESDEG
jgi:hypothetical protein